MKTMKRLLMMLVVLAMVSTSFACVAFADGQKFELSQVTAKAGDTVEVNLTVSGNPGVAVASVTITYPAELTLVRATDNGIWTKDQFSKTLKSPYSMGWMEADNMMGNGDLVTLEFTVAEDAAPGNYPITLSYKPGDICNGDLDDVDFDLVNGVITVEAAGPVIPTAASIGLKTDDSQILRLSNIDVNNVDGTSYKVDTALGFVSCVNKDANATGLYTEINLEGWTGEALKIPAKNTTTVGDQIYFVAAVTSIREANLKTPFTAKAYATVDGQLVEDSNTVSAAYDVQQ